MEPMDDRSVGRRTIASRFVRRATPRDSASQRSIIGVVIDSIGCSPNAGSSRERTRAL
jgi:hypothetical protein